MGVGGGRGGGGGAAGQISIGDNTSASPCLLPLSLAHPLPRSISIDHHLSLTAAPRSVTGVRRRLWVHVYAATISMSLLFLARLSQANERVVVPATRLQARQAKLTVDGARRQPPQPAVRTALVAWPSTPFAARSRPPTRAAWPGQPPCGRSTWRGPVEPARNKNKNHEQRGRDEDKDRKQANQFMFIKSIFTAESMPKAVRSSCMSEKTTPNAPTHLKMTAAAAATTTQTTATAETTTTTAAAVTENNTENQPANRCRRSPKPALVGRPR